ncbi:MAG: AIR synthase-related protein, partial [Phormidium sp.]
VEKSQLLSGSKVEVGDVAIALASQGIHSNGFSLVRKIVSDGGFNWSDRPEQLGGKTLGEILLTPTQIYVKPVLAARSSGIEIHGMAHITGGGLPENLPRCLGADQSIEIIPNSWNVLPIFDWLAAAGKVNLQGMFETFNMGIGFVVLVNPEQEEATIKWFESQNISAYCMGKVIPGTGNLVGLPE